MSQATTLSAYAVCAAKRKLRSDQMCKSKKMKKDVPQDIASDQNLANESVKLKRKTKQTKSKIAANITEKNNVEIMKPKKKDTKKHSKKRNVTTSDYNIHKKKELEYNFIIPKGNDQLEDNNIDESPIKAAVRVLEWMIHPVRLEDFFKKHSSAVDMPQWEKHPLHIKRHISSYYKCLVSTSLLDKVLRENDVLFTKNIDITSYTDGVRETLNPSGRALANIVWDYYLNGCSVRMLNPQAFIHEIYMLCATLQEFFDCFVGCNLYLTPPNSQGFAPHYDDIEAFILQIEGKKRWRIYKPSNKNEYLARYSSKDFDQSEIGEPIIDTVVQPGDLLYFPRGTIHQAETIDNNHSLHITLSVYQKNSWCDFFEKLLPQALQQAAETDKLFREGLPLNYLKCFGAAYNKNMNEDARSIFKKNIKTLFTRLIDYIDIDSVADMMAKRHIHDFLPPSLTQTEEKHSVMKDGLVMANGIVTHNVEIEINTKIRLLRSHCIRLIKEDDTYVIYFSTENSKTYHELDPQYLVIDEQFVPAIRKIIRQYPEFTCVKDLPISDMYKIQIATDLWEKGLVITDSSLKQYVLKDASEEDLNSS